MLTRVSDWIGGHGRLVFVAIVVLAVVVIALGFALYQEYSVNQSSHSQTDKLLNQFLAGDTSKVVSGGTRVAIRLQNVRFKWSDRVYIDSGNMAIQAVPIRGAVVDFDDLESFRLEVQQSVVEIRPDVLAGMFNESVFNYPGSRIRELKVSIVPDQTTPERLIQLDGKVDVVTWVPFTMFARLSVDTKTNTMVITVDHLKVFHVIPATKLIHWTPLQLDRLIALPPNQSLMVDENRLMVKPFGLFPPPRINGRITAVHVDDHVIRITFAGEPIPAPQSTASNYVYLRGGLSQFGHFRMADTNILILDKNPANPFTFSLMRYSELIPRSDIFMPDTKTVRITMPDL